MVSGKGYRVKDVVMGLQIEEHQDRVLRWVRWSVKALGHQPCSACLPVRD